MLVKQLSVWLVCCALCPSLLSADDKPSKPEPSAPAATPSTEKVDPFQVPAGTDTAVLQKFLSGLGQVAPEVQTRAGVVEHLNKLDACVAEIMGREIEVNLFTSCIQMRREIHGLLARFGDTGVVQKQTDLLKLLKADERPEIKKIIAMLELSDQIQSLPEQTSEDRQKLVQKIATMLQQVAAGDDQTLQETVNLMMTSAQILESLEDPADAIAAYQIYAKNLEARKDDRLKSIIDQMGAVSRRLGLLGNSIAVQGTTLTGEKFDIASWKGKVVLVDFWATWCGPCIAELPNVKNMYEAYHAKGFEVVGISLDEDRAALESFLKEEQIAWITLFDDKPEHQGWENPIARHYGISGIPTVILVNQEGKVVSLEARGPALAMELEKLLGPPLETKKPVEDEKGEIKLDLKIKRE